MKKTTLTDFVKVLKIKLQKNRDVWSEERWISVGCSTCGDYDVVHAVNMEELDKQIDDLCAEFQKRINAATN